MNPSITPLIKKNHKINIYKSSQDSPNSFKSFDV